MCNAYQGDNVKFSWTRNGKILIPNNDIEIFSMGATSALSLRDTTTEDSANYTCIANNDISEDRSTAFLTIEGLCAF